jgi:hypothetical protein
MKLRQIYSFGFVVAVATLLAIAVFMSGCEGSIGR